jgi:hypothetical protein
MGQNIKTETRYGVSAHVDGTTVYVTGFIPNKSGDLDAMFTDVAEDACTWKPESTAQLVVAALTKSMQKHGWQVNVYPVEEPTYND